MNENLLPAIGSDPINLLDLNENHTIVSQILWSHFDADYYISRYSDIDLRHVDPILHYCVFGWKEGRDPAPNFSAARYLEANKDVAECGVNPFLHWVVFGKREGRVAFAVNQPEQRAATDLTDLKTAMDIIGDRFDAAFYRRLYPDMDRPGANELEHFCLHGWREKRNPAEWFSTALYLAHHEDVAASGINPFAHYIMIGEAEQRTIFPVEAGRARQLAVSEAATLVASPELRDLIRCRKAATRSPPGEFNARRLRLHWVLPDFGIGSGGHMTIFRIVHLLEQRGHECTLWIDNPVTHKTAGAAYDDILKHFTSVRADIGFTSEGLEQASGDIILATGWQTVARVCAATGFAERAYFVQDYEPSFYAVGSQYLAAENTYHHDLACICASPWLASTLHDQFGRWTRHFWLAFDAKFYFPPRKPRAENAVPRIAVYARTCTARRSVELALLALEHLAAQGVVFHADLFGDVIEATRAPFPCTLHGVLDAEGLANLYRECDLGICFSTTNYSLAPKEMMACGLPVLEIDRPSTQAIFPPDVVTLTGPDPIRVANDIGTLLADPKRRACQAAAATAWIANFSWEKSAEMIETAMIERLTERGHTTLRAPSRSRRKPQPTASVCIPTFNGGPTLLRLLDVVRAQLAPWPFEIVVVDSSSTDGTAKKMQAMPDLVFHTIAQKEFGHGRTRNHCAQIARGEAIAFLTQDAVPTDSSWLFNLVSVLMHFPNAAGAFGRHTAHMSADEFTTRDLTHHFAGMIDYPIAVSRDTDPDRYASGDPNWRKLLHFFSDNNSCLRRSAWEQIPYPDIDYGEDQVWADQIIAAGWEKVYVPNAVVRHSHDYTPAETRQRAATEARFFREHFGYSMLDASLPLSEQIAHMNRHDTHWAKSHGVHADAIARRCALNEARLIGYNDDRSRKASVAPERRG